MDPKVSVYLYLDLYMVHTNAKCEITKENCTTVGKLGRSLGLHRKCHGVQVYITVAGNNSSDMTVKCEICSQK